MGNGLNKKTSIDQWKIYIFCFLLMLFLKDPFKSHNGVPLEIPQVEKHLFTRENNRLKKIGAATLFREETTPLPAYLA